MLQLYPKVPTCTESARSYQNIIREHTIQLLSHIGWYHNINLRSVSRALLCMVTIKIWIMMINHSCIIICKDNMHYDYIQKQNCFKNSSFVCQIVVQNLSKMKGLWSLHYWLSENWVLKDLIGWDEISGLIA